ncbi:MAG TPA: hypothetical protein VFY97_05485 [Rhodanobacteraceae bacterium]|nr:hypothetical protein [Rhodanobacteraceae bacterium]
MIRKIVTIVAAIAINCAVLAWFHAWSAAVVAAATPPDSMREVVTLPVINVHPSAGQLRALRKARAQATTDQANADGGIACLAMPYYSFAAPCGTAANG